MKKLSVITGALFLLTACEPSVEDLAKDHEKRQEILTECQNMGIEKAQHEQRCKNAFEAQKLAIKQGLKDGVDSMLAPFTGGDDN